jgi:hypothetical protein
VWKLSTDDWGEASGVGVGGARTCSTKAESSWMERSCKSAGRSGRGEWVGDEVGEGVSDEGEEGVGDEAGF